MMQKLTRAGSGVLQSNNGAAPAAQGQGPPPQGQQSVQSVQSVQQQQQQQQQMLMRQQAAQQSSARLPAKRAADGETITRSSAGHGGAPLGGSANVAGGVQRSAYNNDKILSNLQSAHAVTQAVRASRSAGSDLGLKASGAGAGRGGTARSSNNINNNNSAEGTAAAASGMVTRGGKISAAARGTVTAGTGTTASAARFLPRLGSSGKR